MRLFNYLAVFTLPLSLPLPVNYVVDIIKAMLDNFHSKSWHNVVDGGPMGLADFKSTLEPRYKTNQHMINALE